MIRIVYAQSRKPNVDPVEFVRQWREHGAMALTARDYFGDVVRYVQASVISTNVTGAWPGREYDGVGEICFENADDLARSYAAESRARTIVPHGRAIFGSPNPINVVVRDIAAWADHEPPITITRFLRFAGGISQNDRAASLASRPDRLKRAVRQAGLTAVSCRCAMALEIGAMFDAVEEIGLAAMAPDTVATLDPHLSWTSPAVTDTVTIAAWPVVLFDRRYISS